MSLLQPSLFPSEESVNYLVKLAVAHIQGRGSSEHKALSTFLSGCLCWRMSVCIPQVVDILLEGDVVTEYLGQVEL